MDWEWPCEQCTYINPPAARTCEMCSAPRQSATARSASTTGVSVSASGSSPSVSQPAAAASSNPPWFASILPVIFPRRAHQSADSALKMHQIWHAQGFAFNDTNLIFSEEKSGKIDSAETNMESSAAPSSSSASSNQSTETDSIAKASSSAPSPMILSSTELFSVGFAQFANGPCGVLASVQSIFYRYLLFAHSYRLPSIDSDRPSSAASFASHARLSLAIALAAIVWRARSRLSSLAPARLVVLKEDSGHSSLSAAYSVAGLDNEFFPNYGVSLEVREFNSFEALLHTLHSRTILSQFVGGGGCLLLLYSMCASRNVKELLNELNYGSATEVPANFSSCFINRGNGFCQHELVNFILCGQAISNLHNDDDVMSVQTLGSGIRQRAETGFLSVSKSVLVLGSHLRTPHFPVWTVLSKSHYTTLFATQTSTNSASNSAVFVLKDDNAPSASSAASSSSSSSSAAASSSASASSSTSANAALLNQQYFHFNGLTNLRWHEDGEAKKGPRLCKLICFPFPFNRSTAANATSSFLVQHNEWTCGTCSLINPSSKFTCEACGTPKRSAQSTPHASEAEELVFGFRREDFMYFFEVQPRETPMSDWRCLICGFDRNPYTALRCQCTYTICNQPHPSLGQQWSCHACSMMNPPARSSCQTCDRKRVITTEDSKFYDTYVPPKRKAAAAAGSKSVEEEEKSLYVCRRCDAVNDPKLAADRCATCNSPRYKSWLCEWKKYSDLSKASQAAAFEYLPDIVHAIHILQPDVGVVHTGQEPPSLTT